MHNTDHKSEIIETVNKLFVYTDSRQWDQLQQEVFAGQVHFDMSSLGGPVSMLTSREICDMWNEGFKGIDHVYHLAGNYIVTIHDTSASVLAYATATHYKASAINGKTREFIGSYDIGLTLTKGGWRIHQFKYNMKFMTGNASLE